MATLRQDFRLVESILREVTPGRDFGGVDEENFRNMLLLARDAVPNDKDVLRLLLEHTIDRAIPGSRVGGVSLERTEFPTASRHVCQVKGTSAAGGTGFLVGPDLVLTAAHVLRPAGDWLERSTVSVTFDLLVWRDNRVATRVDCTLASDGPYPIAFSLGPVGDAVLPQENELDYALVRITPGVGGEALSDLGSRRGWFAGNVDPGVPALDLVTILQHPNGRLLKVAQGSVLRLDVNSTRMRYGTSTELGSSGGPVLNRSQRLVGLHVLSDRVVNDTLLANEGVSFSAIFADLARQGVALPAP